MPKGVSMQPVEMEIVYSALAVYSDDEEAAEFITENVFDTMSAREVAVHRKRANNPNSPIHADYVERREKVAAVLEGQLVHNQLTGSLKASVAVNVAIDQTKQMLDEGKISDTARAARDLQQVISQMKDNRLALEGRPTQITQTQSAAEILDALEHKGLAWRAKAIDATVEEPGQGEA